MPVALDPSQTFEVFLDGDAEVPEATRPVFICHYMAGRKWKQVATVVEEIDKSVSGLVALTSLYQVAAIPIVGWRNMGDFGDYEAEKLWDVLTPDEVNEFLGKILDMNRPGAEDLGKSQSQ